MTVSFQLDGLSFVVGCVVTHGELVDITSIHVQRNAVNIRKLLDRPALEIIEEAAEKAIKEAGEEVPFDVPLLPAEAPVNMNLSPTLAEVNARRGCSEGGAR
jgi:hypothetical protein